MQAEHWKSFKDSVTASTSLIRDTLVALFLIIALGILRRFLRVFVYLALVPSNAIAVVTTRLTASETLMMRELVGS